MDESYLDELEAVDSGDRSADERARVLEARARELPAGSEERTAFLSAAGDHWGYAEDPTRAEAAYRAAIADGGDPTRYAEGALVLLLLQASRETEADELLEALIQDARAGALPVATYEIVGSSLEEAGRLRGAMRWYTMPLRDVDPEDLERGDQVLLHGRWRVRQALGLAEDCFDLERERLVDETRG